MRHYSLIPVKYNAQQLLTRCEPIDAELWSIQWQERERIGLSFEPCFMPAPRLHWFADVAPLEYEEAQAIVTWLNNREQFAATLPDVASVTPFRSK